MAEVKATQKVLFARIAEAMADDAEVVEMCEKFIARLEKPRKATPKAETPEAIQFRADTLELIKEAGEGGLIQKDIAAGMEVSSQKMTSVLRKLKEAGLVVRVETKGSKTPDLFVAAEFVADEDSDEF